MMNVKMELNQELNGVELYFTNKPAKEILETLKANSFRWSGYKMCWYAKQKENTLKLAQKLSGVKTEQEPTTEETVTAPKTTETKKQNKNNIMLLFERVQFTKGTTDTSKYNYKYVGSNYTPGLTTKEIAKIIRQHLKTRFPEVKFSVTSDYNSVDIDIKSSPYNNSKLEYSAELRPVDYRNFEEEHNKEINAILEYCARLAESYNYDDSDSMTDYFNCNFYKHVSIHWEYTQTEQTETIKADIEDFRNKLEQQAKEEEERKEREYQEYKKQQEEQNKAYQVRKTEEVKEIELINNSIEVKELAETEQYFIVGSQFAHLNKNNTLDEYREEVQKGEYNLENVKITKEVHFNNVEALNYFSNLLLNDFDFLAGTGGSFTDDNRFTSMIDFYQMEKEERESVIWNLYGVAIYYNNELQFVVDAQGHSYARYVGLVDNVTIQKELNVKQFVDKKQLEEFKNTAESLEDISFNVITELDIVSTWDNENWNEYKELMKEELKKNKIKLKKEVIQQLPEESEKLKVAMYKLLTEVDSIQEQFKEADIQQGQKLTLFYISDFGSVITSRITFDSVENKKYAQYNNAVKLTFKQEKKRGLYSAHFYSTLLVYNGWLDLPETVLNTVEKTGTGFTVTKSKYLSCDKKQYDDILNYFGQHGLKPIVNTYKPVF